MNSHPPPLAVTVPLRAQVPIVAPLALRIGDAARAIAVSTRTVRRYVERGELPASRLGRMLLFEVRELEALLERTRIGQAPEARGRAP